MLMGIAINLLWLAIGIIILGLVVYIILRVVSLWWPLDGRVVQAVWLVFGILCLIALLTTLGGGANSRPFWKLGDAGGPAYIEQAA